MQIKRSEPARSASGQEALANVLVMPAFHSALISAKAASGDLR